jgi:moderate conductance mechanosensitive channel
MDIAGTVILAIHLAGGTSTGGDAATAKTCADGGGFVCDRVLDWTNNQTLADWTAFIVDRPLKILLIILVAVVVSWLAKRVINRTASRIRENAADGSLMGVSGDVGQRRVEQRTQALSSVLTSIAKVTIWTIALMIILGELGVNLGPLIAGAGIVGVALGFGAQSVVKDFLAGIFMLAEDQYGVGDVIDLGEATGTVEKVTLRTTVLRDVYGTVWHVPNGEIQRVGNKSQLWAVALLDVGVAYSADTDRASEVIKETADAMFEDEEWRPSMLEEPQLLGVQALGADSVTLRLSVKTKPAQQFPVERELLRRIKAALDSSGIEIPFPQRTIWVRRDDPGSEDADLVTS